MLALAAFATAALNAAPVFYLSTSDTAGAPAMLNLTGAPGATGTLFLWGNSPDVRIGGISLDVISSGDAIKFNAPLTGPQAGANWSFVNPPTLSPDGRSLTGFGAAAIPPAAGGFGAGSPAGPSLMLGSFGYTLGAGTANLRMEIGDAEITDYDGGYPMVHFGTAASPARLGSAVGEGNDVGGLGGGVVPPVITDATIGPLATDTANAITHQFAANQAITTWTLTSLLGPAGATPTFTPSLSATGSFSWAATKADLRGMDSAQWVATVSGQNANGSDTGTLTINLVIPEPATLSLVGLAMIGLVGLVRRR
jgi:hypothetical protein